MAGVRAITARRGREPPPHLEGILVLVVGCVVSSLDRKGWEERDRRAALRESLSFTLKTCHGGNTRE